jgi:glycine cleavage system H protein
MGSPPNLKFSKTHEWCSVDGDVATIGLSQHAVEQLTDLVYIDLPGPGTKVEAGAGFGEVESVKAVSEINSPVSGQVLERNDAVIDNLGAVSGDPYGDGWLIKVTLSDPSELDALTDAAAYDTAVA